MSIGRGCPDALAHRHSTPIPQAMRSPKNVPRAPGRMRASSWARARSGGSGGYEQWPRDLVLPIAGGLKVRRALISARGQVYLGSGRTESSTPSTRATGRFVWS